MANAIEMTEATPEKRREILEQSFGGNLPGGPLLLDDEGALSAVVQVRVGATAELDAIVLKDGEIAIERDSGGNPVGLRSGDGETAGGYPLFSVDLRTTDASLETAANLDPVDIPDFSVEGFAGNVFKVEFALGFLSLGGINSVFQALGNGWVIHPCGAVSGYASDTSNVAVTVFAHWDAAAAFSAMIDSAENNDVIQMGGAFFISFSSSASCGFAFRQFTTSGSAKVILAPGSRMLIQRIK